MEKINRIINIIKQNKWVHYSIIVIIGVILSIPLIYMRIRDSHDGALHLLRILGTVNTFKIGQFPPLVAPYFCNGGGYAMNLFYNPIVTYIPLLIKLFTPTYALALKIFASLTIILSGITMYHFVFSVTKKRTIALFASIIYLVSPYKLGDVYRRFAIGEFTAFVFIPILFNGIYNLFNQDGKKHYLIAIGAIGLMLTHTVTTFYMAIFSAVYVLVSYKKLKDKEIIKKLIINVLFIVLVSLFFIAPMYEAKKSAEYTIFDSEIMSTNGEYVFENTLEINEFFNDKVEKFEDTIFSIGIPIAVLLLFTIYAYRYVVKEEYKDLYLLSLIFSIVCLYMSSKYCPWTIFPNFLCMLQYPWRMLGFFNFFTSFIIGVNIYFVLKNLLKKDITRFIIMLILTALMITYTVPLVMQFRTNDEQRDVKYETKVTEDPYVYHMHINRDYLPTKALLKQSTYLKERDYKQIYVIDGKCDVFETKVEALSASANIENYKKDTVLEFPFFFYPGYEITLEQNGKIDKLKNIESENGFVSTTIDKDIEMAKINVEYKGTIITYISYVVSFVSFIGLVIYIIMERKKYAKK